MKPGRIILALVFLVLFVVCLIVVVKGWASYSYESVFPEDVNAVIQIHKPMDVPLKVLNSTAVTKFFATKNGKEILDTINQGLAAAGGDDKKGPKPTFYKEDVDGVTVFYIIPPATPPEENLATGEAKVPEKKPAAKGGNKLSLDTIKKGMAVGGAVVKDIYVAVYGNPMELMADMKPKFMVALDLGRVVANPIPSAVLSGQSKPAAQMPKDAPIVIGLAFMRNLVMVADPEGIKRMVHVAHGTSMKGQVKKKDEAGNETTAEVAFDTKPLGKSDIWKKAKAAWGNESPNLRLTLLVPSLLAHFQTDPTAKGFLDENGAKFGLNKLIALELAASTGASGLKIQTTVVADAGHPLFKFIDQPEIEMKWPDLLPNGFTAGAGLTAKNFEEFLNQIEAALGEQSPTPALAEMLKKVFGVSDVKAFLKNITGEISFVAFATGADTHTVYCLKTAPAIKDFLAESEKTMSEQIIATAESKIAAAKTAGAESFAADMFKKAQEALDGAKNAKGDKKIAESIALARKAVKLSDAALMGLYNQASSIMSNTFLNASDQETEVKKVLEDAKAAFDSGNVASGVENSRKALDMARCAWEFEKAMKLIADAKTAEKDTPAKPKSPRASAEAAMAQAQAGWKAGNYSAASTQAQSAASSAKTAITAAGGTVSEPESSATTTPSEPEATLPEIESPRVVQKVEVFSTAGETPMDYAFFNDNMCIASSGDIEAFIATPRGGFFKTPNAQELFQNVPRETQGLAVVDILANVKGLLEEKIEDKDIKDLISGLNLLASAYLISTPTTLTIATVLPVKLFDGSAGGGLRTITVIAIYLFKLILYILTVLFIYLTVKMIRPKKA